MIKETDYKCPDPNCKGVMLEHRASGNSHWLECDCCGEIYTFVEYFEKLEEKYKGSSVFLGHY